MSGELCPSCGRDWFAACICPGTDANDELMADREQLAQGVCPRTGERIMPGGNLRPACTICDCGDGN